MLAGVGNGKSNWFVGFIMPLVPCRHVAILMILRYEHHRLIFQVFFFSFGCRAYILINYNNIYKHIA